MVNDREIVISTTHSRNSLHYAEERLLWSVLVERLGNPVVGTETMAEYLALPKPQRDDLKDVGGFVAGRLLEGRRKAQNVVGRDVITLDLDNIPAGQTDDVLTGIARNVCAYAVYSTRKHSEAAPRLRLLVPLDRTVTAEEYEPIARRFASFVGLELCDSTTFEASRMMYYPSRCADGCFVHTCNDAPFMSADWMLTTYADWRDASSWLQVPGAEQLRQRSAQKQGDPLEKEGIVGAFCKTYSIQEAIDTFLPGVYLPCDDNRLTFAGGSTMGGAVLYDDGAFLFSHHATDPCSGALVNAFDLVRKHLFGGLDENNKPGTPSCKLPSYVAMKTLALGSPEVSNLIKQELYAQTVEEFSAPAPSEQPWVNGLKLNPTNGKLLATIPNIQLILENDPLLKGKLAWDARLDIPSSLGALPWDNINALRDWTDADDKGLRGYLETVYNIHHVAKTEDALSVHMHHYKFNAIQDYLKGLAWDGKRRISTLLMEYLGAEDNKYTREVTFKALVAAVARAMSPGCKFDNVLILVGPQRIGKSTLLRYLGREWFSDSYISFDSKDALSMIQKVWIVELGELSSLSRSEANVAKQFISRTEDTFRASYEKHTKAYPRKCVFFGTTNDTDFLKDPTGNGRYWPVVVWGNKPSKNVFNDLPGEVDQIWAEAVLAWRLGETLYLTPEIAALAEGQQEEHLEVSPKEGVVQSFLERPLPLDWDSRDVASRRFYWQTGAKDDTAQPRSKVCVMEIWCELFEGDLKSLKRGDSLEIGNILRRCPGWEGTGKVSGFSLYGPQRYFIRKP